MTVNVLVFYNHKFDKSIENVKCTSLEIISLQQEDIERE
jgi:hypothetical protein